MEADVRESAIRTLIEPILDSYRLELDALQIVSMGKRQVLRVTVDGDGPEGRGPLLDDISAASSAISAALDGSDAVGSAPYTLEVSSRGVSTPLREPKHFRRNRGRVVKVSGPELSLTGRVVSADDEGVRFDVDGAERVVAYPQITKAVVQVEMSKAKDEEN